MPEKAFRLTDGLGLNGESLQTRTVCVCVCGCVLCVSVCVIVGNSEIVSCIFILSGISISYSLVINVVKC